MKNIASPVNDSNAGKLDYFKSPTTKSSKKDEGAAAGSVNETFGLTSPS